MLRSPIIFKINNEKLLIYEKFSSKGCHDSENSDKEGFGTMP
jgi:hypothetical protein